jgi:hypothetical protein
MRLLGALSLAALIAAAGLALASPAGDAGTVTRLPAPITITAGPHTFRLAPGGHVRRVTASVSPFPGDAGVFGGGVWYAIRRRHLLIGVEGKTLWRSRGEFPSRLDFDLAIVQGRTIAFAYGQRLYTARVGGSERLVAGGEFPLGWTAGGFFAYRFRGRQLLLRDDAGALRETVARGPLEYAYDRRTRSLYFIAGGAVMRSSGARTLRVASLARLGLAQDSSLSMQALGGLLELLDGRHLVVLRPDGSAFAEAMLPGQVGIDSPVAISPDARAVAFSTSYVERAAQPDPARGALALETVDVLRAGARTAIPVHREQVQFAPCLSGADVEWRGSWLLFAAGEGHLAVIDTAGAQRTISFTPVMRALPGADDGFGAYWARRPPVS